MVAAALSAGASGILLLVVITILLSLARQLRALSTTSTSIGRGTTTRIFVLLRQRHNKPYYCYSSIASSKLLASSSSDINMSSSSFKRAKLEDLVESTKVIGTHSGTFQADEAMGVWMLRQLPSYRNSKVVRSRDLDVLNQLDIVIDVGGTYDHDKLRYDHHQRDYDERFDEGKKTKKKGSGSDVVLEPRCTKLSASGLVYRHYGKDVIKAYYPNLPDNYVDIAYEAIYDKLLEALDAIDTGVEPIEAASSDEEASTPKLRYKDSTGLSSRVGRLNPRWNEVGEGKEGNQRPDENERFELAVAECGRDFLSVMVAVVESDIPAREIVEKAVLARHTTDSSGQILKFPNGGMPWKNHLYDLEREHNVEPTIKFVLYQDVAKMWRVQAVTVEGQAFANRLSLPEEWRGVRDADLEKVTGIPGSRFCHAAGFIGGNDTYEGALKMAQVALSK